MSNAPIPKPAPSRSPLNERPETDLAELAALFAAQSGPGISPHLSTELALEIVLNQIVENACLATGATGAAIILTRDGEMVCRATSGGNAPELGSRPDSKSGLTAECIRTGQMQICDDALIDPRADAEASRNLGIRSVVVVPLIEKGVVIGALEAFSSGTKAFGERDCRTLEALGERVLKNLKRACEPVVPIAVHNVRPPAPEPVRPENRTPKMVELITNSHKQDLAAITKRPIAAEENSSTPAPEPKQKSGVDIVTVLLAAACIVCLILIVSLITVRARSRKSMAVRSPTATQRTELPAAETAAAQNLTETAQLQAGNASSSAPQNTDQNASKSVPLGGLVVYEAGKEVFRLSPSTPGAEKTAQPASSIGPEEIINLSPDSAESSVTYRQEPDYPEEARRQGIQGPVVLDVRIGRDGAVENATLVSGQEILGKAAIAAVKQWRFKPHSVQGSPAEMQTRITLNFRLPQ